MRSATFSRAERKRRNSKTVTAAKTRVLARYSKAAGVEMPICRWDHEANDAIERMKTVATWPTLGPMG